VFANEIGELMPEKRANDLWRATCGRANIDDLRFHDLRHEAGSRMAERGAPLTEVRDVLGHTTFTMTKRYLQTTATRLRATVDLLDSSS